LGNEKNFLLDIRALLLYRKGNSMCVARFPEPDPEDVFFERPTNYRDLLRVNKMIVSERNPYRKDIFQFEKACKEQMSDVVKKDMREYGGIKITVKMRINFEKPVNEEGEDEKINEFFEGSEANVIIQNGDDENKIQELVESSFNTIINKVDDYQNNGSEWSFDNIDLVYIDTARYQPLRNGIFVPLPTKLKNKTAIINVQNKDNECLKWAISAALFPARKGKNPIRPVSYPTNNGTDWSGIDFPTPLKQINKLEVQNKNLSINVFGWDGKVNSLRISKAVNQINLMLYKEHFSFAKNVNALLYDKSKHRKKKHYCMLCLSEFSRGDLLEDHKKYCKGLNGRPTRIEMPSEGKFVNHHKQNPLPFMIYADFEALIKKISYKIPQGKNGKTRGVWLLLCCRKKRW